MKPNVLLTGNLLFLKLEMKNTFVAESQPTYMACDLSGCLFGSEIYTYSDIKQQWPDIKQFSSLKIAMEARFK